MSTKKTIIPNVFDGGTFKVAGIEFIKFPAEDGKIPAVAKDILFLSRFGSNNDFRESRVLQKLEAEVLPKIIDVVREDSLHTIRTDLTTLDGLKTYGVMESRISLPTLDFYRKYVEIFDKYKVKGWWWLATPESAPKHSSDCWTLCVSPSGSVFIGDYGDDFGVRPVLLFDASIFESSGAEE